MCYNMHRLTPDRQTCRCSLQKVRLALGSGVGQEAFSPLAKCQGKYHGIYEKQALI